MRHASGLRKGDTATAMGAAGGNSSSASGACGGGDNGDNGVGGVGGGSGVGGGGSPSPTAVADAAATAAAAAELAELTLPPVTPATPHRADLRLLDKSGLPTGGANGGRREVPLQLLLLPGTTRGQGACGRVVEGLYGGRRVAVKLVADTHTWGGPSEELLQTFEQEVEVLGRCEHANVVRLIAACLQPPRLCLVMELMETSLDRVLHGRPGQALMPLDKVLHIAIEIARGLAYLHPFIVHRDCKPANVLLNDPWGPRPVVKITDFGLSRLRSTVQATRTPGAGTPAYLAPEGYDAAINVITHQADIYSFGVVLWEMLSGSQPWQHRDMMTLAYDVTVRGQRLPLKALEAGGRCPHKLRLLLQQCWEQDPRRRPAAAELVKELARVMQYSTCLASPGPTLFRM
ncbi:putative serine/threonine-protein kinase [Tetrabaena socialis]|uniref:Putative serine/threonine-protein kinase n=1 Tax=Tetrabaena socialis TaxID=47790 RepID=A0A2J8A0D4_9CHLO|nr:putative serine/threonine-protein kinase [Tetrabaena socialis]|eukprot:PNH05979.1 putative serine/threonine-protein kinase [Tetrabaena socialis]